MIAVHDVFNRLPLAIFIRLGSILIHLIDIDHTDKNIICAKGFPDFIKSGLHL